MLPWFVKRKRIAFVAGCFLAVIVTRLWQSVRVLHAAYLPPFLADTPQEAANQSDTSVTTTVSSTLTYLPWEIASMPNATYDGNNCQPPPVAPQETVAANASITIDPICCLGSRYHFSPPAHRFFGRQCAHMDHDKLKQHVLQVLGGDDYQVCDACRIFDLLLQHNLSITFWGDSVQAQIFNGFECALQRQGYRIVGRQDEPRGEPGNMFQPAAVATRFIASDNTHDDRTVALRFFYQYKPNPSVNGTYQTALKEIIETTDVLVVNFGVHFSWKHRARFRARMQQLWEALYTFASHRFTLLAFRETTAQHFDADGGDYHLAAAAINSTDGLPNRCVPMQWGSLAGWREAVVKEEATRAGFRVVGPFDDKPSTAKDDTRPHVVVLPFFNFTAEHPDLHPTIPATVNSSNLTAAGAADCTHYCSTPFLWMPLWRSLRVALERKLQQGTHGLS